MSGWEETASESSMHLVPEVVASPAPVAPSQASVSQPATTPTKSKNHMKWSVEQFTPLGGANGEGFVKCKICGTTIKLLPTRPGTAEQAHMMRKHSNKEDDKSYVSPPVKVNKRVKEEAKDEVNPKKRVAPVRTLMTKAELADFLEHWAQRACPFSLIDDHTLFPPRQVEDADGKVHNLNRQLLKRLIVEHGEALVKQKLTESKGKYCSVALDLGTMQSKRTMDVVVHTEGQEFLYSVEPIRKGEGTAVGLYKVLLPILKALHAAGLTVIAVVTDNASNLTAMERLVYADFPEIVFINCAIHSVQLLVTDAVYSHPDIVTVWKIIDDVRAKANKHGLVKVPKLAPTRWNYAVRVLEHLVHHFEKYHAADCMSASELVAVEKALVFLLPFQVITKYLERTKANILDIAVAIRSIDNHTSTCGADVRSAFLHRLMLHFSSDAHVLATVFASPYEDWTKLSESSRRYLNMALMRLCRKWGFDQERAVAELNAFLEGGPQTRSRNRGTKKPSDNPFKRFWAVQAAFLPGLYEVYRRLEAITASEAACERAFSRQKQSHTDIRNRLEADTICALLRCATISVGEDQPKTDEKEDDSARRRLSFTVPANTLTPVPAFLTTLVYCAKFAAAQELQIGSAVWLYVHEGTKSALRDYRVRVVSIAAPAQHFFAKKLPEKFDEDGVEQKPRDRFLYSDRFGICYEGSEDVHELISASLTEEADEWEPWYE